MNCNDLDELLLNYDLVTSVPKCFQHDHFNMLMIAFTLFTQEGTTTGCYVAKWCCPQADETAVAASVTTRTSSYLWKSPLAQFEQQWGQSKVQLF